MTRQIYILETKETKETVRDALFSLRIVDLHRKEIIDTIFMNLNIPYLTLRAYCQSNQTDHAIEIQSTSRSDRKNMSNYVLDINKYSQENPSKKRLAFISEEKPGDSERLVGLLKKVNFQVEILTL